MKPFRLSAFAIALALAACTTSPTDPARLDPAAARYEESPGMPGDTGGDGGDATPTDGGNTLGSGNFTSDSTNTGNGRGGNTLGSGN